MEIKNNDFKEITIISSNNKHMKIIKKDWSSQHESKKIWLYNYAKTLHPEVKLDNFIETLRRKLDNIIENNSNWANGSKEALYFMLSRYYNNNGNTRLSKIYQTKGIDYLKLGNNIENENKLDAKEEINYRPHQYFIDILNLTDYKNIDTYDEHLKYLLLSCLVLQPTLRTDFYKSASFIRTLKEDDKKNNFVHIDRRGKTKINFIVNNDKVSKTKFYSMNKNLNIITLIDDKLIELINYSFTKYPRKYLFDKNDKPISNNTILSWLRSISKVNGITIDIMRSSYVTWFYKQNAKLVDRNKLANQMRHSVLTALKNYNKVIDDEIVNKNNSLEEINKTIVKLTVENSDLNEKLVTPPNDKLFKKRRIDIIYQLNKKNRNTKESTMKLYDIKFNKETNMYY